MEKTPDLFLSVSETEKLHLFEQIRQLKVMEKTNQDSLKIYQRLTPGISEINLRQVALQMHKSYGSIYNTYDGIVQDMKAILGKSDPTIPEIFAVSSDQYQIYLISHTDSYNFLRQVLSSNKRSFTNFYQAMGNSKATALRHLKPMRTFLKKFDVRVAYEPMRFIGREQDVRIALTVLYWRATQGLSWPFDSVTQKQASELVSYGLDLFHMVEPNNVTKDFFGIFLAVSMLRMANGHLVDKNPRLPYIKYPYANLYENAELQKIIQDNAPSEFTQVVARINEIPSSRLMAESVNVYNAASSVLSIIPYTKNQSEESLELLQEYDTVIYDFVAQIIQRIPFNIQKRLKMDDQNMKTVKINLVRVIIGGLAFGNSYYQAITYYGGQAVGIRTIDMPEYRKQIRDLLLELVEEDEFSDFQPHVDLMTDAVYNSSLRLMALTSSHYSVKIYPEIEDSFLAYLDLIETIKSLPYVDLVDNFAEADLIITATEHLDIKSTTGNQFIFKWSHDFGNAQFGQLITVIRDIWTQKKISG